MTVFATVLPVFAAILAGWAFARWRGLGADAVGALNAYVVWLALPALLFGFVARADRATFGEPRFVLVCAGAAFATFALALVTGRRSATLSARSLDALTAAYSNAAYLGLPICAALFGPVGVAAAVIASLVTVCAMFALAVLLVEADRAAGGPALPAVGRALGRTAKNPLVAAPLAGAVWAAAGWPVPAAAASFLTLVGTSATPVALVTIGMFLAQPAPAPSPRALATALGFKFVVQPALTLVLLAALPLPRPWGAAALLLAALPTGTGPFMAAQLYGEEVALAARATLVGTVLALGVVPLVVWWAR